MKKKRKNTFVSNDSKCPQIKELLCVIGFKSIGNAWLVLSDNNLQSNRFIDGKQVISLLRKS